jgi:hypothetical protein
MSSNDAPQGQFVERPESLLSPEDSRGVKAGRPHSSVRSAAREVSVNSDCDRNVIRHAQNLDEHRSLRTHTK